MRPNPNNNDSDDDLFFPMEESGSDSISPQISDSREGRSSSTSSLSSSSIFSRPPRFLNDKRLAIHAIIDEVMDNFYPEGIEVQNGDNFEKIAKGMLESHFLSDETIKQKLSLSSNSNQDNACAEFRHMFLKEVIRRFEEAQQAQQSPSSVNL